MGITGDATAPVAVARGTDSFDDDAVPASRAGATAAASVGELACLSGGGRVNRRAGLIVLRRSARRGVTVARAFMPRRAPRSGVLAPPRSLHPALPRAGSRRGFDARRPPWGGGACDARDSDRGLTRLYAGPSQDVAGGEGGAARESWRLQRPHW